jgi:VWFA-related protein
MVKTARCISRSKTSERLRLFFGPRAAVAVLGLVLLALSLAFLVIPGRAAAQEVVQPPLRHEVSARLVLVDLAAVDHDGRFAFDLTRDDFELFEDGKKVMIKSADLVRLKKPQTGGEPGDAAAAASGPARDNRFFVVFDSINTIKRMLDRNKSEILQKLVSLIEIGEQIMVLEMVETGEVQVLQSLTQDKALVTRAVERASGSIWVERASDTLAVPQILAGGGITDEGPYGTPIGGNKFEKTNRDIYELETRRRFEKTINSLLVVLTMIKDYPGRKSILYVSGGIPAVSFGSFMSGQGGTLEDTTVIQTQVAAAKIQDPFKSLKKQGFRSGQEILEDLTQFANSHNISFYALDPDNYLRYVLGDIAYETWARSASTLSGQRKDGIYRDDEIAEIKKTELGKLKNLTGNTGGVAFLGGSKFEQFQRVIERDLGSYYELSYVPPRKEADGKYHTIKVRLLKPDIDIRFRPGYMDYNEAQNESLVFASAAYNPSLFRDLPFEARVIPFVQGRDKYSLWIQTALPLRSLVGDNEEKNKPIVLKFKILVDDMSQDKGFLSEVALPLVLSPAFLKKNENAEYVGFSCCSQELVLSLKQYRVNVALYNEGLGRVGTVEQVVSVPGNRNAQESRVVNAVLGSLSKNEGSSGSSFSISAQDGTLDLPGYKFYPMAVHDLDRTKVVSVLLQVTTTSQSPPLQAEFSLYQGEMLISPLSSKQVSSVWNKKASLWNMVYAFVLGDFFSGDYSLKVRMVDPSGGQRAETTFPIRIL